LHNTHNVGCYVSKNIAMQYARGTWLTFHDADDYSMCERFEKQLTYCTTGGGGDGDEPSRRPREREAVMSSSSSSSSSRSSSRCYDCCYVVSLSRKEKVWAWSPITMFVHAATFRAKLGSFDPVRFGADSEMRDRLDAAGVRVGVLQDYLYACPDRWIELASRTASLTGNTANNSIRVKYKNAYKAYHQHVSSSHHHHPDAAALLLQLHYAFSAAHPPKPRRFDIPGLSAEDHSRLFPRSEHVSETNEMHIQFEKFEP
jgi:glycosyltransferase involved in cell wall biosynthesis